MVFKQEFWILGTLVGFLTLWFCISLGSHAVYSFLIIVNILNVLLCGLDKAIAAHGYRKNRVPESAFYAVSILGGSPLLLVSLRLFRHKTSSRKTSFRRVHYLIFCCSFAFYISIL